MNPVCVLFRRMGPSHLARLNAAAALVPIVGLELSDRDPDHPGDNSGTRLAFRRVTLFPGAEISSISPRGLQSQVYEELRRTRPAAVAVAGWWEPGAIAALSWCATNLVPAIMMSDSQASDAPRSFPREALKRRIVDRCSSGLVAGTAHAEYLTSLGLPREHIFTGYDVVDNTHFRNGADVARSDEKTFRARHRLPEKYFLACARFVAKKNLLWLLQAYQEYCRTTGSMPWNLVLVGDGPLLPALREEIARLSLTGVHLVGWKSYHDLPIYYGLAGALVHASTTEQWGLVVNEAMASGLPVLVSQQSGCARDLVVHGRNGFVFDADETGALTDHLRHVAADRCDRSAMALAGREIIARWSPGAFAEGVKQAVEAAISRTAERARTNRNILPQAAGMMNRLLLRSLLFRPA